MVAYFPDRGDVIWLNFSPQRGHEQAGQRPALVLSSKAYNQKTGLMLVCPITSKVKNYPFEVMIELNKINGVVLADQVKNLDWDERKPKFITKATTDTIQQVQELIKTLLER